MGKVNIRNRFRAKAMGEARELLSQIAYFQMGIAVTYRTLLVATCMFAVSGPAQAQQAASAPFINAEGREIGTVQLTNTPHGVLISGQLAGLPAGEHGFHVHETGRCDASDGFKSAGNHFAPAGHSHGFLDPAGPHAGDMANQSAPADGTLHLEVFNPYVTLDSGENSLFDADGSALVVHADPDDYKSQPSGDAGSRIACAVVEKP
ncbi:superoxide dismutase family protein [Dongia deserti]|uniref:superoxide dismutase family protein n=1 Tax=Dongia deserti TaxID=2268030 RepID=UPI002547832E|nr:superoxide dismutase family protein [Dongia deserti]